MFRGLVGKSKRNDPCDKEWLEDQETIKTLKETVKELLSENKKLKQELRKMDKSETLNEVRGSKHHKKSRGIENPRNTKQSDEENKEQIRNKWKKWREDMYGKYEEND